ncbi:MAG: hypothetical protein JWQ68_2414, partial [Cryobacterium sp.]|nr:hypothetical protein [Cryobacterium sp.]
MESLIAIRRSRVLRLAVPSDAGAPNGECHPESASISKFARVAELADAL